MVAASLSSLKRNGAFIEVAKRDIWSPQRVAQERPDLNYCLIAIDFWTPEVVGSNLQRLSAMLTAGTTHSVYPCEKTFNGYPTVVTYDITVRQPQLSFDHLPQVMLCIPSKTDNISFLYKPIMVNFT